MIGRVAVAAVLTVLAWGAWGFEAAALFQVGMLVGVMLVVVEFVPDNEGGSDER